MNLIQNIPWTKLNKDAIWANTSVKYMTPAGRFYHNMEHVVDIYKYAAELNIPYDINLDVAILFHDVIYDRNDNKEIRSTYEFVNVIKNFTNTEMKTLPEKIMLPFGIVNVNEVIDSILATISHAPSETKGIATTMVMLDLYGFAKNTTCKKNFNNLMKEIGVLYDEPPVLGVYQNIKNNLLRLYGNITYFLEFNKANAIVTPYSVVWDKILVGLEKQVEELDVLIENQTP